MSIDLQERAAVAPIIAEGPDAPAPFDLRALLLLGLLCGGAAAFGQGAGGRWTVLELAGGLLALAGATGIWWSWTRRRPTGPIPTTPEESTARQEELRREVSVWRRGKAP